MFPALACTEGALEHDALGGPRQGALGDLLPGFPNRALISGRWEEHLRAHAGGAGRAGAVCLHINRLQDIYDCYGLQAHESVLGEVAGRLSDGAGRDGLVAVVGVDEVVVVLPDVGSTEASAVGKGLIEAIGPTVLVNGREAPVTASAGVALTGTRGPDVNRLMEDAALASHVAAKRGPGQVEVFEPGLRHKAEARLDCETELYSALARGELQVWYQPIVSVRNGALVGAEALIRWPDARRGFVRPDEVVAAAERSGLIGDLGETVLRSACRDVAGWRSRPELANMAISVNVSGLQLSDPAFSELVKDCLRAAGLEPGALCLELTENALTHLSTATVTVLGQLRSLGVSLAVDDFGTGFSSLAYLREFPLQVLKLDRCFVAGIGTRRTDTAIVRSTLELARALGLMTVAEGVETLEQLECLRDLGCDNAQGYFWSLALPAAEFLGRAARLGGDVTQPVPGPASYVEEQASISTSEGGPGAESNLGARGPWWALLDALPLPVAVLARDGEILAVNKPWELLDDASADLAHGRGVGGNYLEVCERRALAHGLRAVLAGERDTFSVQYYDKVAKSARRYLMLAAPVTSGPGAAVVSVVDITEVHNAELARTQHMEALGRLAGGIAHEINTPCQFISDNLTFLANAWGPVAHVLRSSRAAAEKLRAGAAPEEVVGCLGPSWEGDDLDFTLAEVPEAIAQSKEGVDRVATIVRAMKSFGHPDGTDPEPTDINRLVADTLTVARNELKYVADVSTDFGAVPMTVCYRAAVSQAVLNLLVNAAHALQGSHEATGRRGRLALRTWAEDEAILIEVSDTGPGIPPNVLPHIFEPFFTTKPVGEGTGQGLAMAWATIVERHGGTIDVRTSPSGTAFVLRLPPHGPLENKARPLSSSVGATGA